MLKRFFFTILFLVIIISIIAADNLHDYFPNEIAYDPVRLYLHEKNIYDGSQVYHEYLYILAFLRIAMQAHEANIRNYHAENTLIALCPTFENGNLIIAEVVHKIYTLDKSTNLYYEKLNVDVTLEFIKFILCFNTYNDLLHFWFDKNGEMLYAELKFDEEITKVDDPFIKRVFNND